jgi:hypothetical protein
MRSWPKLVATITIGAASQLFAQSASKADDPIGILLAAGDVGKCGTESDHLNDDATGKLIKEQVQAAKDRKIPVAVLALGDLAYDDGTKKQFECFYASWTQHFGKDMLPVPGNHEYNVEPKAAPYFGHFKKYGGDVVAANTTGYYSFIFPPADPNAWHLIALNSPLEANDKPADPDSTQIKWLRQELANDANGKRNCVLAFWHHFVFSSGLHGHNGSYEEKASVVPGSMQRAFAVLDSYGTTAVLSGHDHNYEQFSRQDVHGIKKDKDDGIRSFVIGTGGGGLYNKRKNKKTKKIEPLKYANQAANSERYHADSFGVLRIELFADRYTWAFLPIPDNAAINLEGIDNDSCTKRRKP